PVSRPDEELALNRFFMGGGKMENAGVLEKASNDRPDSQVFRATGNTRTETAKSSNDQIHGNARGGCVTQRLHHLGILELVHFCNDPSRKIGSFIGNLP